MAPLAPERFFRPALSFCGVSLYVLKDLLQQISGTAAATAAVAEDRTQQEATS